jgi:hypothetical protein
VNEAHHSNENEHDDDVKDELFVALRDGHRGCHGDVGAVEKEDRQQLRGWSRAHTQILPHQAVVWQVLTAAPVDWHILCCILTPPRMKFLIPLLLLALPAVCPAQSMSVKSFADLEKVAADLAQMPCQAPSQQLNPFFESLKYIGHRQIRFLRGKALFADLGDTYHLEFFHSV